VCPGSLEAALCRRIRDRHRELRHGGVSGAHGESGLGRSRWRWRQGDRWRGHSVREGAVAVTSEEELRPSRPGRVDWETSALRGVELAPADEFDRTGCRPRNVAWLGRLGCALDGDGTILARAVGVTALLAESPVGGPPAATTATIDDG